MSSSSQRHNGLDAMQAPAIRQHLDEACQLPPHPEEWLCEDVEIGLGALMKFQQTGVIQQVGRKATTTGLRHVWQTCPDVAEEAERIRAEQTLTPCRNATGIRTIEAGSVYTCTDDDCDCRMDRETAEQVVA